MKRLTTDKPDGNVENSLNLFYIKDQWTWVRGGGPAPDYKDVSLCDLVRMMVKANIPDTELPKDDDNLSMMMYEWLMDEPDTAEGIIALLYNAGWAFAELRQRLAAYEDTGLTPEICANYKKFEDEAISKGVTFGRIVELMNADKDGRLVVLPCRIDTPIYLIRTEKEPRKGEKYIVEEYDIDHFTIGGTMIPMITACSKENEWEELIDGTQESFEYFLTREEAEKALKGRNDNA